MPKDSKDSQEVLNGRQVREGDDDMYFSTYSCFFFFSNEHKTNILLIEKKIDYIFRLLERKSFTLLYSKIVSTCKHHLELLEKNERDLSLFYEINKCFLTSKEVLYFH